VADAYIGLGISNTLDEISPTQIETKAQLALEYQTPWTGLLDWQTHPLNSGLVYNLPSLPAATMGSLSESGTNGWYDSGDNYQPNMTSRSVTVSGKGVDVWPTTLSVLGGVLDLQTELEQVFTFAGIAKFESDVMALYSESNTDIGSSGSAVTYTDHFLAGYELLIRNKARKPFFWALPVTQVSEVLSDPQFSQAQQYGRSVIDNDVDIERGYLGFSPLGVPLYSVNNYTTSSGVHGIMASKFGIRVREMVPFRVDMDATKMWVDERSLRMGATWVYGVGGTRATTTTNPWIVDIVS
jgi:hypothetical protein